MGTCYLAGAAPGAYRITPRPGDLVIAADGGLDHLLAFGLTPDVVIGDFDSARDCVPKQVQTLSFLREKDETDMELALREGLRRGFLDFVITGGSGGRLDHTCANLQLLIQGAKAGAHVVLHVEEDGTCAAALLPGDMLRLAGKGRVSVLSMGEKAEGVDIFGFLYPLSGGALFGDTPRGISNVLNAEGSISLERGILLVFWERDSIRVHRTKKEA